MAMYEMGKVKLGDVEGQGYAFSKKTVFGKTFQGVFFPDDEEALERLDRAICSHCIGDRRSADQECYFGW